MQSFYGSKLNTVLLLILIVLMIFALRFMYQNQEEYRDLLQVNRTEEKTIINQSKEQINITPTDEFMEEEAKWADAENGMPKGWVRWSDKIDGISVEKYGPSSTISSYMIKLDAGLISKLDEEKKCVGDSESAICAIGNDTEVLRYWNVINHYY